jgi:hypothetical protein
MSLRSPNLINNPLTISLYVDDFNYFAAPTPPGSEERIIEDGEIRITQDDDIRITE